MNDLNLICKIKFGSHLYGTSTPESDTDYKGIYLPSIREVYLSKFPKCVSFNTKSSSSKEKNSKEDVDFEVYSLHYFIELAMQGETFALDMVHAPIEMLLKSSPIWVELVLNRKKLYTKNLNAFVGYARSQASKYGIKGSRLNSVKMVIDFLNTQSQHERLEGFWDLLPMGEHIDKTFYDPNNKDATGKVVIPLYTVCGKKLQSTATVKTVLPALLKYYEQYGERAKLASNNEAIDWKAVSHAIRAALEVEEILTTGDLKFPLKDAEYLKKIKSGQLSYIKEVGPFLEKKMEELEVIAAKSSLPETVDKKFWEDFILKAYGFNYV